MSDDTRIDPRSIYTISAAARLLGVSPSTLRDLERRGTVECRRTPGGQRRFPGFELIRLLETPVGGSRKKPDQRASVGTTSTADATARQAWLGQWIARAQRELPADTPAEIRLRLGADLERALRHWGPAAPTADVAPLVKGLIERALLQAQKAQEEAQRRDRKAELLEHALAHLRRSIDALPRRLVGPPNTLTRRHMRATLRDQLRAKLHTEIRGDEGWDAVRDLADEFLAAWYVGQTSGSRTPNTVKLLAVGATGAIGGAVAAAALDPRIRSAATNLKEPLLSLAGDLLKRFGAPPPSTAPPPNQPTTTPPPSRPSVRWAGSWPYAYRRTARYDSRPVTPKSQKAAPGGGNASAVQDRPIPSATSDPIPPESASAPRPPA